MDKSILVLSIILSKFTQAAWVRGAVEPLLFVLVILPRYIKGRFQNKRAAANT